MDLAPLADGELARLLQGDRAEEAFTVLYQRYVRAVHDFVARTVRDLAAAEDITQRALMQAWEQRSSLRDPDAVKPWLYRIAGNLALNHVTRTRPAEDIDELASVLETTDATPEAQALSKEAARLVWDAAASLEPRQRTVLELSVRQELSRPEIAEVLGIETAQASLHLHRAKEALGNAVRYLLVARRRTHCARLAEMVPAGVLRLSAEQRASVDRHMRRCDGCQGMASRLTSPEALLGAMVLLPLPPSLERAPHLRLTSAIVGGGGGGRGGGGAAAVVGEAVAVADAGSQRPRRRRRAAAWLVLLLLLGGVALVVPRVFFEPAAPVGESTMRPSVGVTPAVSTATPSAEGGTATSLPIAVVVPSETATPSPRAVPAPTPRPPTPRPTPTPGFTVTGISLCFVDANGGCNPGNTSTQTCVNVPGGPGIVPTNTWQCPFRITFTLTPGTGGTIAWSMSGTAWSGPNCVQSQPVPIKGGTVPVPTPAPSQLTYSAVLNLHSFDPSKAGAAKTSMATVAVPAWPHAAPATTPFYGTAC